MEKLLLVLTATLLFTSCSSIYLENNQSKIDSEKETTLKVLNQIDTTNMYYVVIDGNTLYAINTQNKVVEYKVQDITKDMQEALTVLILIIVVLLLGIIVFNW